MKKTLSARRVPREIGGDEDDNKTQDANGGETGNTTLKRPSNKPRKSSSIRTSFGPAAGEDDDAEELNRVVAPKRSNLSRIAIQRNASRSSLLAPSLPTRRLDSDGDGDDNGRPSYSAASLQELKASTPATPRDLNTPSADNTDGEDAVSHTQALDLSSKFGSTLSRYQQDASPSSTIPSAAEIAEKKARRARLAKEQAAEEFISLDPDDPNLDNSDAEELDENVMRDDLGRLVLKPKDEDKYSMSESRLVRDDEDMMEGFDDFTEDGTVHLGRKAEIEAAKRRKQEMATQIAEAENHGGTDSEDSDASEKERNAAFEAAQTRHGTYGADAVTPSNLDNRPRTPPIITPVPTLEGVLERLRKQVIDMQSSRMRKLREMDALRKEKLRLAEEEVRIQRALRETAEKFRELRKEKGIPTGESNEVASTLPGSEKVLALTEVGDDQVTREQEDGTLGADEEAKDGGDEVEEKAGLGGGHAGLGNGFAGLGTRGLGSTPGMGVPGSDEDDW